MFFYLNADLGSLIAYSTRSVTCVVFLPADVPDLRAVTHAAVGGSDNLLKSCFDGSEEATGLIERALTYWLCVVDPADRPVPPWPDHVDILIGPLVHPVSDLSATL